LSLSVPHARRRESRVAAIFPRGKTIAGSYDLARPDREPHAKTAPRDLANGVRVRNLQKISKETPGLLQAVLSGRGYISCHALSRRGLNRPRRQQF
jgi:hypothetical protein